MDKKFLKEKMDFVLSYKYRKLNIKELKKKTNINTINYKKFWKKYDKHYSKLAHNFYYEKTGVSSKYFIPDDFWFSKIDMFYNDWNEARILDDKSLYDKFFYDLKTPEIIAKKIKGEWFVSDELVTFNQVLNTLSSFEEVVCKPSRLCGCGSGLMFLQKSQFNLINDIKGDFIVQKIIKQSNEMMKLCDTSINTIRIMTLIENDSINILSSIVRFGVNGSRIDNASAGGLTCGIKENGFLKSVAYKSDGTKFTKNPNNDLLFENIRIPNFEKVKKMALECHGRFPYFKLISWDIAINENDEPLLIEGNFKLGELDFHQLNNGPIFGDKTEDILNKIKKVSK